MKILNLSNKIIEFSFYGLFLLVPLVFSSQTSELFEFNKMWLTFGLTILITSVWIIKMVVLKKFWIQKTPLDIPIALFLISQIISTILSWDIHVSIWGYYSRFNGGLLSIISYIILYYAFLSNFSVIGSRFSVFGSKSVGYRSIRTNGLKTGEPYSDNRQLKTDNRIPDAVTMVKRLLMISLAAGGIVALWGLPSHFGFDPTCLLFKGSFDVSCWTADFQPKLRIFSTLGQPAWLGAYLSLLIPITIAFILQKTQIELRKPVNQKIRLSEILNFRLSDNPILRVFRVFWKPIILFLIAMLFYVDLLFTKSRAALIAVWISLGFLFIGSLLLASLSRSGSVVGLKSISSLFAGLINRKPTNQILKPDPLRQSSSEASNRKLITGLISIIIVFLMLTTVVLNPIGLKNNKNTVQSPIGSFSSGGGGTESGTIRLFVWQGALNAWLHNPLFGTGVETFAFAYYKYKPIGHNLTSEWNFLYNKAHNEYLNYLATTGIFGLGSYLFMIGLFGFITLKKLLHCSTRLDSARQVASLLKKNNATIKQPALPAGRSNNDLLILALLAGYISILVTNFFGFSIVIINLYLFMIPAFVFVFSGVISPIGQISPIRPIGKLQKLDIFVVLIVTAYLLASLVNFWFADKAYALGSNLSRSGVYDQAYLNLQEAVKRIDFEPTFKDELASNNSILAFSLLSQLSQDEKQASEEAALAENLAREAIIATTQTTTEHPRNVVFWKTKVRVFYTLSQVDPKYLSFALDAIKKAQELAPADANISYNLGLLYGQSGDIKKAMNTLNNTIKLKPNYINAYYALGLFYRQLATNDKGAVIDVNYEQKAINQMEYILKKIDPKNQDAKQAIETWTANLPN